MGEKKKSSDKGGREERSKEPGETTLFVFIRCEREWGGYSGVPLLCSHSAHEEIIR